ncbi:MAG: NUDIX domain-containing protein [Candidatus Bipolaricaulota bacterium]|nr:NUDIX domain-containing protein [Candidatus Bipolaricaulota bacterium]
MKSTLAEEEPEERSSGFVLYALEQGERRYLLLRHQNGGHWGFPKGHIEDGEGERDAALREALEETGIDLIEQVPGFREVNRYHFPCGGRSLLKEVVYFLGRVLPGEPVLSNEHLDGKWFPYAAACETITYEDARRILATAERHLRTTQEP